MTLLFQAEDTVPASREDAFALAADIEAYPAFLPMCRATRIVSRTETEIEVDNLFGIGPLAVQFRTLAHCTPPERLLITSEDEPFKHLEIEWQFHIISERETLAHFRLEATLHTALHERLMRAACDRLARTVMTAFRTQLRKRSEQF